MHYFHRDKGNWKDHLESVVDNPNNLPLGEIANRIKSALLDGEYFYHTDIGLLPSEYAESGDWHEYDHIELSEHHARLLMSVDELLEQFQKRPAPKVIKVPSFIPIHLATSWLEFLREPRESVIPELRGGSFYGLSICRSYPPAMIP